MPLSLKIYTWFEDDPDQYISELYDTFLEIPCGHGDPIVKVTENDRGGYRAQSQDGRFDVNLYGGHYARKELYQCMRESDSEDHVAFFSASMTQDVDELVLTHWHWDYLDWDQSSESSESSDSSTRASDDVDDDDE